MRIFSVTHPNEDEAERTGQERPRATSFLSDKHLIFHQHHHRGTREEYRTWSIVLAYSSLEKQKIVSFLDKFN